MGLAIELLSATINTFEANKRLADRAIAQVPDEKLSLALDANTNSVAVIMQHIAGLRGHYQVFYRDADAWRAAGAWLSVDR